MDEVLPRLTSEERERFSRHLLLPEVGELGQRRLKNSRVLLIGAGGLGSPVALYLAAAGVGVIGLVDEDVVERSNLQRQILHGEASVGERKVVSAARRLRDLAPTVEVVEFDVRFRPENAREMASGFDVIVDGSDNFATRFLSNDVAYFLGKPLVYGSIFRFGGQVSVLRPGVDGPCYRCFVPEMPEAGVVPNCAEAGVLGVVPGVVGSMQAMEALKILLKIGEVPVGRMLCYDGLRSEMRVLRLVKDVGCALCGGAGTIDSEKNRETEIQATCMMNGEMMSVTVEELREKLRGDFSGILLDVRQPEEFALERIEGSRLVPLGELAGVLGELPRDGEILVHCKSGMRSARAVRMLMAEGFGDVKNVEGGIDAWLRL